MEAKQTECRTTREVEKIVRGVAHGELTRRQFIERGITLGLSLSALATVLAACGDGETEETPAAMDTAVPEEIFFYTWSDYIPPDSIEQFRQETGIKVTMSFFDDQDAMLAKLKSGATGWDVVNSSGQLTPILAKSGLLQPLDMAYIPNFQNVTQAFQKPPFDPEEDGNKYSAPFTWGTTGLAVRLDKVSEPVTSWDTLWDAGHEGDISMLNDMRETLGVSLKRLGLSCNTTSQDELDQAAAALIEQKPLIAKYDSTPRRVILAGMPLVHAWDGDALRALDELGKETVAYVLPDEGYVMWTDNFVVPVGAKSPYAAHLFMNFWLDPKVAGEAASYMQYFMPVVGWEQYTDPTLLEVLPTDEELQRGEHATDVGEFSAQYVEAWTKVKSA